MNFSHVSLCAVYVYTCLPMLSMYMHVCLCVDTHMQQAKCLGKIPFLIDLYFMYQGRVSHMDDSSLICLVQLAAFCRGNTYPQDIYTGVESLESGPHSCEASALPTEQCLSNLSLDFIAFI